MIQRKIIDDLLRLLNHFPAVGIIGPRQCGKTTLAKAIMSKIERPCIYLDLELFSDASKLEEPELFFRNNMDKCIVLDEIQHRPELFLLLRSVIDQDRIPARFIILGSASPVIMRNTSESLAGRIAYKELYPFNLMEVNARDDMKT
ncbi:MAG: AAA family ATPase, partial [Bacteroidetes bacterium]|nr:AAA family ATPase [Bacteroidota bacterium]